MEWLDGSRTDEEMTRILRARDHTLRIEFEAAHYLHAVAHLLVDVFPASRFVLTIREPGAWLRSEINQTVYTSRSPLWTRLEVHRYGRLGCAFEPEERGLSQLQNVYPIANYLTYWTHHYRAMLAAIPVHRLLVLPTTQLVSRAGELAAFLDVPAASIDLASAHAGRNDRKAYRLEEYVPSRFIAEQIERYCPKDLLQAAGS